jgi:NADH-quinone oxidoreductase subunit L
MAGPTPVSALIHAATMVTSGIVLLCRLAPLFVLTPATMTIVAWVGAATAVFAASIGLVQRDIKKVLAYSTVSQLGYMFLGLGAAGFAAGFFHVFTHAWFKALLFLGAGSVIVAMHHEQDLFKMGGLKSKMPMTYWTMLIATLCIIGFPGTSGFASKDEILYLAFQKSPALWVVGVLGACFTAFYMLRLLTLTFHGEPRDANAFDHAKESPYTMTVPLILLAAGSLLAVFLGWPEAFGGSFAIEGFLGPSLTYGQAHAAEAHHGGHGLAWGLATVSTVLVLAAAWLGWRTYRKGLPQAGAPWLHRLLLNKYFVDEGIEMVLLSPLRWLGGFMHKVVDVVVIDGLGINVPAALTRLAGDGASLLQTGRVQNYILTMGLGMAALVWVFLM